MSSPDRFLAERIGLRLDGDATRSRLDRAVRDAAGAAGCPEARLGRLLAADPVRAQDLIDRVTVQESGFFRHPEHFEFLADHLRAVESPGVIWSAGCANGQEAWSLAIVLEEQWLAGWRVLASDVSTTALQRARAGAYGERELRGLSAPRRRRFFPRGEAVPRLRERIRFIHHNIAQAAPPPEVAGCPVVLCRNVLIYLHSAAIERFVEGLRRRMADGALLLIGMGEAIGPLEGFHSGPLAGAFLRGDRVTSAAGSGERALSSFTVLLAEGSRLAAAGELDAAANCFRQAGFLAPEDPRPRARLAAVLDEIARRG